MNTAAPARFYKTAAVEAGGDGFTILLDGKPVRTPGRRPLVLPTQRLADAVAGEWNAQGEKIRPATMPLTRLANTVIDGIAGAEQQVRDDIAAFAGSDLLCYRADHPDRLVEAQNARWNPVLAWAEGELGAAFTVASGVMHVRQPEAVLEAVRRALAGRDAWALAGLHVITTLTGSALLALAHACGHIDAEDAWAAAHVDEDWQISQWGEDAEAATRRARRREELEAAVRLLALSSG